MVVERAVVERVMFWALVVAVKEAAATAVAVVVWALVVAVKGAAATAVAVKGEVVKVEASAVAMGEVVKAAVREGVRVEETAVVMVVAMAEGMWR